jgi:hypothetical protein
LCLIAGEAALQRGQLRYLDERLNKWLRQDQKSPAKRRRVLKRQQIMASGCGGTEFFE